GIEGEAQHVSAGGEVDARLEDIGERVPGGGVGDLERAGFINAVDLGVKSSAERFAGGAKIEGVRAGLLDVDGVFEPFAGLGEADVEAAAGVAGGFDVDAFGGAV